MCEAVITEDSNRNKLKTNSNCKVKMSFIPESGDEIKQEVNLKLERGNLHGKVKRNLLEGVILGINFILFIITLVGLIYWNFSSNTNAVYGQFSLFESAKISLLIGTMGGYFCISNFALILKIRDLINGDIKNVVKYPELHFETDFIRKIKKPGATGLLILLFAFFLFLYLSLSPVLLPVPKTDYFSFYDFETGIKINEEYIYESDISNVRMGFNENASDNEEPFYAAGLHFDKTGRLEPDYYNFTIEEGIGTTPIKFSFKELTDGKRLEGNKKRVFDFVCGKNPSDDRFKIEYNDKEKKFTVTCVDWLNKDELITGLEKLYNEDPGIRIVDPESVMTGKDKTLSSYKDKFSKLIKNRKKSVRPEELVEVFKNYADRMTGNWTNDMKCMRLIWCQFHAVTGHRIILGDRQINKILEMYESYYKIGDIEGIGDIHKSITVGYLRLLLYIEKHFAEKEIPENAYNKVHRSIANVMDSKGKGADYYLLYLKECVRSKVLFVKYAKPGESGRAVFFRNKIENLKKLKSAVGILLQIAGMKEADDGVKTFVAQLIEKINEKPDSSLGQDLVIPGDDSSKAKGLASEEMAFLPGPFFVPWINRGKAGLLPCGRIYLRKRVFLRKSLPFTKSAEVKANGNCGKNDFSRGTY
jgi:hypothetical protein